MSKAFFIDTTRCTACRGCQIACKEWHELKANTTLQQGTHQNPPDLNPNNFKLVRFSEFKEDNGTVRWNFFPDQCRHCTDPPCMVTANEYIPDAVIQDADTGAVIYTDKTMTLTKAAFEEMRANCPYDIPRREKTGSPVVKCDMCIDRVKADMLPMCVKTCCSGTMNFGERREMIKLANERLARVKEEFPKATLNEVDAVSVIYLMSFEPERYWEYAVARSAPMMTRQQFFAKLVSPARNAIRG